MTEKTILVTGATGYVSGRLIPALLDAGYRIRAMGRNLEKLSCRPWARNDKVELVQGDVLNIIPHARCQHRKNEKLVESF